MEPINNLPQYPPRDYSSGLMAQSFWFVEFKQVVRLKADGAAPEQLKALLIEQNLFGAPNAYRARRICGYLTRRAAALDAAGQALFLCAGLQTQKLLNLICILRQDRLLFEFVDEVYREKALLGAHALEQADARVFFSRKEQQSELIAGWAEPTRRRLASCYLNFLTDCGMLACAGSQRRITPPLLEPALCDYLAACRQTGIARAISGVR